MDGVGNLVLLHKNVEAAFDRHQLVVLPTADKDDVKFVVRS